MTIVEVWAALREVLAAPDELAAASRDQRIKELEEAARTPSGYAQGAADANAYRELVHAVELEAASTAYWLEGFRCLPYDGRSRQRESP